MKVQEQVVQGRCYIGCAGWTLPTTLQPVFGTGSSHLHRYASRLNGCEINSSFYRPYATATYQRWADSTPDGFRFSVKLPATITHENRLRGCDGLLDDFLSQVDGLGERLGCLLVQLPPSLAWEPRIADAFLAALRQRWAGPVSMEPRHASWFTRDANALLARHRVARVLADPVRDAPGAQPGGSGEIVYLRLHGSPRMYYSAYEPALITALARRMALELRGGACVWCVFDNTAAGAATENALGLKRALDKELQ